jgi:hypothetical protein
MALVHMPEVFEQWMAWGPCSLETRIKRVGINFGAPGDRMSATGTLWLDYPSVGGPSPEVQVAVVPETAVFTYHHSAWIEESATLPWVAASCIEGATDLRLRLLPDAPSERAEPEPVRYSVRLHFAEFADVKPGQRVFSVALQGKVVLEALDILKESGGVRRALVKEFGDVAIGDVLSVSLRPRVGKPVLCGVEVIAAD